MSLRRAIVAPIALILALAACQPTATTPAQPTSPAATPTMDPNMPGMSSEPAASPTMDPNMPGMTTVP